MVGLVLLALVAVPASWVLVDWSSTPTPARHARRPRHSAPVIYARGDSPLFTLTLLRGAVTPLTVRQQLFVIRHAEACS